MMTDLFDGESPNVLKFVVPGEPVGKGRPKFSTVSGYPRAYTPDKTARYENLVKIAFRNEYPSFDPFVKGIPLKIEMLAYFGIPASWSAKKQKLAIAGYIRPTKKPDSDNISKLKDALNGIVWHDDAQVVDEHIAKMYSDKPRMEVRIEVWRP